MSADMSAREKIRSKIAALRAKTRAAGCTEAEAMAAAELASRLMSEHGLSADEIELAEATVREDTIRSTWRTKLAATIAHCTNTACIRSVDLTAGGAELLFVGRAPGPDIAIYLREVCFRAVARELTAFKRSTFYKSRRTVSTKRRAAGDFVDGLTSRMSQRLAVLFRPVISRKAIAEARATLDARFPNAASMKPLKHRRASPALIAGWQRGANVALNVGVNGAASTLQIGERSL